MPRPKMTRATAEERDKRLQEIDRQKQEMDHEEQILLMQKKEDEVAKTMLEYLRQQVSEHGLNYQDTVFALFHCIMEDDEIFARNGIDY